MSTETRKTVSIECCSGNCLFIIFLFIFNIVISLELQWEILLFLEKNEEVVKNVVTEATTDSKEQSVNFDQFCTLADKWNLYLKNNGLNFESEYIAWFLNFEYLLT